MRSISNGVKRGWIEAAGVLNVLYHPPDERMVFA